MIQADFGSSVAFSQTMFLLLLPVVLVGPKRWAVAAWFVMGNLDASGGQFEATAAFGLINAVKAIVLPAYLIWRLRGQKGSYLLSSLWARIWIAFVVWVGIASLWSPFPLSAAKAVAYLMGLFLGLVVFERAGRAGLLDIRFFAAIFAGTLLLGVTQHFVFDGVGFGFETAGVRFTAFVGAQAYAAALVALLCAVLWLENIPAGPRATAILITVIALFFNGSRTWAVGAALAIAVSSAVALGRRPVSSLVIAIVLPGVALLGTLAFGPSSLVGGDTPGRIPSAIEVVSESDRGLASVQNVAFRYRIWAGVMSEVRAADTPRLLFGHGTSAAAEVGVRAAPHVFATRSLDANRVVHNEWLRALHEWGAIGLILWAAAYGLVVFGLIRTYIKTKSRRLLPILAYLPALTISTLVEPVLVGAGSAALMGLLYLFGLGFQKSRNATERRPAQEPA